MPVHWPRLPKHLRPAATPKPVTAAKAVRALELVVAQTADLPHDAPLPAEALAGVTVGMMRAWLAGLVSKAGKGGKT